MIKNDVRKKFPPALPPIVISESGFDSGCVISRTGVYTRIAWFPNKLRRGARGHFRYLTAKKVWNPPVTSFLICPDIMYMWSQKKSGIFEIWRSFFTIPYLFDSYVMCRRKHFCFVGLMGRSASEGKNTINHMYSMSAFFPRKPSEKTLRHITFTIKVRNLGKLFTEVPQALQDQLNTKFSLFRMKDQSIAFFSFWIRGRLPQFSGKTEF